MAMNSFMHPRNPYRNPPDFTQLAIAYPEIRNIGTLVSVFVSNQTNQVVRSPFALCYHRM